MIPSNGDDLAAVAYLPTVPDGTKVAAFAILGPVTSIKEQSPKEYATRLAKLGDATVIFGSG